MRAYEKKKLVRLFFANQMKKGFINNASTGNWDAKALAPQTTALHNYLGATHNR